MATKIEIEQIRQIQENIGSLNFRLKQLLDDEYFLEDGFDATTDEYVSGRFPLSLCLLYFHNRLKHEDIEDLEVIKEAISLIRQIVQTQRVIKEQVEKLGMNFNMLEVLQERTVEQMPANLVQTNPVPKRIEADSEMQSDAEDDEDDGDVLSATYEMVDNPLEFVGQEDGGFSEESDDD